MSVPLDDHTPRLAYEKRLSVCAEAHRRAKRTHDVVAWARVAALLGIVGTSYVSCGGSGGSVAPVVVSLLVFIALNVAMGRAVRRLAELGEAERYYQLGLARLDGKAEGFPFDGRSFEPTDPGAHPYSVDLDVFGAGSLYSRVCTARTT